MSNPGGDRRYEPTEVLPLTVAESLREVGRQLRRNKIWNWLLTLCLVFVLAAGVVIAFLLVGQHNSDVQQRQSLIQGCHNSNDARMANRVVFDALIDLSVSTNGAVLKDPFFVAWEHKVSAMPPGPDKDQAEALLALEKEIVTPKSNAIKQAENFKNYIAKSYPPINCKKIAGG